MGGTRVEFGISCVPGGIEVPGATGPTTVYYIDAGPGEFVDAPQFHTHEDAQAYLDAHRHELELAWCTPSTKHLAAAADLLSTAEAAVNSGTLDAERFRWWEPRLAGWLGRFEYAPEFRARLARVHELIQAALKR